MRAVVVAALLLAGCAAHATPATTEAGDGITAVAYRVEPTITDLARTGSLAWGECTSDPELCNLVPLFGDNQWVADAHDDAAVFWRANATLSWQDPSARMLRLELHALGCSDTCEEGRLITSQQGKSPVTLGGEWFLHSGENGLRLVASAGDGPMDQNPFGQAAQLSGVLKGYHPVSGPIPLNLTQG